MLYLRSVSGTPVAVEVRGAAIADLPIGQEDQQTVTIELGGGARRLQVERHIDSKAIGRILDVLERPVLV
ncbi:hypothetical protein ACWUKX_16800 [Mesorhizobium sp. f-mel]